MDLKQKKEGLGMTSRRTRNRLVVRLREQGISDEKVLDVINEIPRHLFVDEALAHRAYEDTSLPIGFNPDYIPTLRCRENDRNTSFWTADKEDTRDWHWIRLPNCRSC